MTVKADAHFVDCDKQEFTLEAWSNGGNLQYPVLRDIDAGDIPAKPTEPAQTALSSPTHITDKAGLEAISGAGHYILDNDINCGGSFTTITTTFTGVLDGNDKTISNIVIDSGLDYKAMFRYLGDDAEVRNLIFEDCSITGDDYTAIFCATQPTGTGVENSNVYIADVSFVNCTVTTKGNFSGCLFARTWGADNLNIFRCSATNCNIVRADNGTNSGILIGTLTTSVEVGSVINNLVDCYVSGGTIDSGNPYRGGLAGVIEFTHVHSCYSTATINGVTGTSVGGLVGRLASSLVTSCYYSGNITLGAGLTGGVTYSNVGGLIGEVLSTNTSIIDCYSTGTITQVETAPSYTCNIDTAGGLFGSVLSTGLTILGCYSTMAFVINNAVVDDAGFGYPVAGKAQSIGGLIGAIEVFTEDGDASITIQKCYSSGDVTIDKGYTLYPFRAEEIQVGTFIGSFSTGFETNVSTFTIENCYTWGRIDVTDDTQYIRDQTSFGGFIAQDETDGGTQVWAIDNCYSAQTGTVYGTSETNGIPSGGINGGFLGLDDAGTLTVTDCFWDTETSGNLIDASSGAVGHETEWMQTKSNYADAGWDLDTIWSIPLPWSQYRTTAYPQDYKHLEGETVQVFGDGEYLGTDVVASGAITLDDDTTNNHVGLQFTSKLQPMKIDGESDVKRISHLIPDVYESLGGDYGRAEDDLYTIVLRDTDDPMDTSGTLKTGYIELPFKGRYDRQGDIFITQDEPLPFHLLAIGVKLSKEPK